MSRLMIVRALVGPRPVYSRKMRTAPLDIATDALALALFCTSDMVFLSAPLLRGATRKEEGSGVLEVA